MIKPEEGMYREEVTAMWHRNFHDPAPYMEFYFEEVYGKNEVLLNLSNEEEMRGMLHLNPYHLRVNGEEIETHYIVGVATEEEYRRQGVMRELLLTTFQKLRKEGESFTYLMPADEDYYLPFEFRFGSCWYEQELEYHPDADGTEVVTLEFEQKARDFAKVVSLENEARDKAFALHTEISKEYLLRMEKEAKSDFSRLYYIYDGEQYLGRVVVGAEQEYMFLSQLVCVCPERQKEMLEQVIRYVEGRYHYGKYQVSTDESWEPVEGKLGSNPMNRTLKAKEKKMIMFRILDLEKFAQFLHGEGEAVCEFKVEDPHLKEQEGRYCFTISSGTVTVRREEEGAGVERNEGGRITIGDLTRILFGDMTKEEMEMLPGLTEEGKELLASIEPLRKTCIQEFV